MFSDVFLAMTAGEMLSHPPQKAAYLACHFSSGSKGLSNLPLALPENSLVLVDDSMPPDDHDPAVVAEQLRDLVTRFSAKAVLLDFQNAPTEQAQAMAARLVQALPCPVAVTESYAKALNCPVFLAPPPVTVPLQKHLSPWLGQGIFLEIAPDTQTITVTEKDSIAATSTPDSIGDLPLADPKLLCHYHVSVFPKKAVFTLSRTGEDLSALVKLAHNLGVAGVVGLYQELREL